MSAAATDYEKDFLMCIHFISRMLTSQLILVFLCTLAPAQSSRLAKFVFHKLDNGHWQGTCTDRTDIFQTAIFMIDPARSITSGSWRKDLSPGAVWAGIEVDSGYVDSTISIKGVLSPSLMRPAPASGAPIPWMRG